MNDEKQIILRVVERFVETGIASDEQVNVICIPDNKTTFVESKGEDSRSVMLNEYRVGTRVVWAGFSSRSQTVYLSAAGKR